MQLVEFRRRLRGIAYLWVLIALAAVAAFGYVWFDWHSAEPPQALANATYVGRAACIDCHQQEHADFVGSHHDRAMELATDEAVVGDFNDTTFERLGVMTKFFRRGEEYWVNTEGPDGENHDYQVKWTFGIEPLQQYMVEFPDGRVQVLRVSWDTVKQEWFYVPPPDAVDERLPSDDPTHWTGIAQNWNSTCAECHSTNLQKNYDLATDTYNTTFSEIDVSCEECHGPGSLHIKLANANSLFWDRRHRYGLAKLKSLSSTPQIETCAKCHARRTEVHPDFRPTQAFGDHYDPALLSPGLYHADGQILDEVYVYGSFLQSRMHREGVRCSDCHNPHSLKLKVEGNALCAQCHVPAKYDTPTHHHHQADTPGAACVECHMPATTYMVVDPRRDHSIRVPRPDLTVAIGTPNACNNCHTLPNESPQWAADKILEWYGDTRPDDPHWAPAIAGGRTAEPEAESEIMEALRRPTTPAIVRATLLNLLSQYRSPEAAAVLRDGLTSSDWLVRRAAASNLPITSPAQALDVLAPLLSDPVRAVRIATAIRLLDLPSESLDKRTQDKLVSAVDEFKEQLRMANERAAAHLQLAQIAGRQSDMPRMIDELRTAIRLEPYLSGPRSELALILSQGAANDPRVADEVQELRSEEIKLLERDIALVPGSGEIRYRLGMLHYLVNDLASAEQRLAEAHQLEPRNYQFALALALLQQERYSRGEAEAFDRAVATLKSLNELDPQSPDAENILRALVQLRQSRLPASDEASRSDSSGQP